MSSTVDMLLRRLRMLLDRAVLTRVSYRGNSRVLQIAPRAGQTFDGIEHLEPYGFTSHALDGAEAVVANLGGNASRALVLLVNDRRHRIVIEDSETAIYTANGDLIHLKKDGSIRIKAALKIVFDTPAAEFIGTLHAQGAITSDIDVVGAGISLHNHQHREHDGPNTSAPL